MSCDDFEMRDSNFEYDSNSLYTDNDREELPPKKENFKNPGPEHKTNRNLYNQGSGKKTKNEVSYSTNPYISSPENKTKPAHKRHEEVETDAKERVKAFLTKYAEEEDPVKQEATEVIMLLMKFYQVHISKLGELVVKKEEEAKYFENQAAEAMEKLSSAREEAEQAGQEKIESMEKELDDAKKTIGLLDEEVMEYRKILQEKEKKMELLEIEKQQAQMIAEAHQNCSKDLSGDQERGSHMVSVAEESQLHIEALEKKLEVYYKDNTKLLEQLDKRDVEINQLDRKVHGSHSRIMMLEEELSKTKNELFDTKMKVLEAKNVKRENEVLLQELQSCKAANSRLQTALESTVEELSDAKFQLLQTESCSHSPPTTLTQNSGKAHATQRVRMEQERYHSELDDFYERRNTGGDEAQSKNIVRHDRKNTDEEEKNLFIERHAGRGLSIEGSYGQRPANENRRSFGDSLEDSGVYGGEHLVAVKNVRGNASRTPPPNMTQKRKPLKRFDDSTLGPAGGEEPLINQGQKLPERNPQTKNRSSKLWTEEMDGAGRPQDVSLMPSDAKKESAAQSARVLENELASLNEARRNCELKLSRLPGNPKKAKEREMKEKLEDEVERISSQINSTRLKMKKLNTF